MYFTGDGVAPLVGDGGPSAKGSEAHDPDLEPKITMELTVTLPPTPVISQLKEALREPLSEMLVAPGEISPTIDSTVEINEYVKELI